MVELVAGFVAVVPGNDGDGVKGDTPRTEGAEESAEEPIAPIAGD
jgi:hypothetical protein